MARRLDWRNARPYRAAWERPDGRRVKRDAQSQATSCSVVSLAHNGQQRPRRNAVCETDAAANNVKPEFKKELRIPIRFVALHRACYRTPDSPIQTLRSVSRCGPELRFKKVPGMCPKILVQVSYF